MRREFWPRSTPSWAGELPVSHLSGTEESTHGLPGHLTQTCRAGNQTLSLSHRTRMWARERQHRPEQARLRCARPAQWSPGLFHRFFFKHLGSSQAVLSTGGSRWNTFSNVHKSFVQDSSAGLLTLNAINIPSNSHQNSGAELGPWLPSKIP